MISYGTPGWVQPPKWVQNGRWFTIRGCSWGCNKLHELGLYIIYIKMYILCIYIYIHWVCMYIYIHIYILYIHNPYNMMTLGSLELPPIVQVQRGIWVSKRFVVRLGPHMIPEVEHVPTQALYNPNNRSSKSGYFPNIPMFGCNILILVALIPRPCVQSNLHLSWLMP